MSRNQLTKEESTSDTDKNNAELKARLGSTRRVHEKKLETAHRHRKLQSVTLVPKS